MAEDRAGGALDIEVDQEDTSSACGHSGCQVDGDCGFSDASFLVGDCDYWFWRVFEHVVVGGRWW